MTDVAKVVRSLTPEQERVLIHGETEAPFSGALLHEKDTGMFVCAACDQPLFSSDAKFDSGSGWPSFYEAADVASLRLVEDTSHGMHRVEVRCSNCDSHLGHVFHDAPDQPTGLRFCINSVALGFLPKREKESGEVCYDTSSFGCSI